MAGAAIIVSLQQLKGLLGITHFTKKMGLVPVLSSVFSETNEVSISTRPLVHYLTVLDHLIIFVDSCFLPLL